LAAGTNVTTSTPGAPDAFTRLNIGDGSITSVDDAGGTGAEAVEISSGSTARYVGWTGVDTTAKGIRFRWLWKSPSANPTTGRSIAKVRSNGAGTSHWNVALSSTGRLQIISDADSSATAATATNAVTASTWYDISVVGSNQSGTGADTATIVVRDTSGATLSGYGATATGNLGATSMGTIEFGSPSNGSLGATRVKYLQVETGPAAFTSELAAPGANQPPVATAPADVYAAAGTPISLTWVASDPDGTVASFAVTQTGGPTLALAGSGVGPRTATPSTIGVYTYSGVATDNAGATSTPAVVRVCVYDTAVIATPRAVESNPGGWTDSGATGVDAVDGTSGAPVTPTPSTYTQTPDSPSGSARTYWMNPAPPGGVQLRLQTQIDSGVTGTVTATILQGDALTAVAAHDFTPGTSWAVQTWDLDSSERALFTQRGIWALKLSATAS
jgi:hypothetical protein